MNKERIEIVFKDGTKDWIDPVLEEKRENGKLIIHNGFAEYDYDLNLISEIKHIQLQDVEKGGEG